MNKKKIIFAKFSLYYKVRSWFFSYFCGQIEWQESL